MNKPKTEKSLTDNEAMGKIKEILSDREKRLNNLYMIQDKHGRLIKFRLNQVQKILYDSLWYLNLILKSRQHGMSTFIAILFTDVCIFNSNTNCGIIADTLLNAMGLLKKIRMAYVMLPNFIKRSNPLVIDSKTELSWKNGSSVKVGTSMRSGTVQYLHISEFGKICARDPGKATEIVTGALEAVTVGQHIFIESTAEGQAGKFHDYSKKAEDLQKMGRKLTKMDYKFHFFAWFQDSGNVLDPEGVEITKEMKLYFDMLQDEHGIILSPRQKAWYVKKEDSLEEQMFREHPSIPEEAFKASVEGAYYSKQFTKIRKENRLGLIPINPNLPVHTAWDLGINDLNSIWFFQVEWLSKDMYRIFLVDFYENQFESIGHYITVMNKRGYTYGVHLAPHDIKVTAWGSNETRLETARKAGINFEVVAKTNSVVDDIEVCKNVLSKCWFHEENCVKGIEHLEGYQRKWDKINAQWTDTHLKNGDDHCADAFRTMAMGVEIYCPNNSDNHADYDSDDYMDDLEKRR